MWCKYCLNRFFKDGRNWAEGLAMITVIMMMVMMMVVVVVVIHVCVHIFRVLDILDKRRVLRGRYALY